MFFAVVPYLVRLNALRRESVAPIAISLSVMAALVSSPNVSTILQVAVASAFGLALRWGGWPRAPFILGFVLGGLGETSFNQTATIWGWTAIYRPLTAILVVLLIVWLVHVILTHRIAHLEVPRFRTLAVASGLIAFFIAVIVASLELPLGTAVVPLAAAIAGLGWRPEYSSTDGGTASAGASAIARHSLGCLSHSWPSRHGSGSSPQVSSSSSSSCAPPEAGSSPR